MNAISKGLYNLKEYQILSLVVAFCYFAGYFSFTYHYRILGLANVSATPLEYFAFGGDFFISSAIKMVAVPIDNSGTLIQNLFSGEFRYITWILGVVILLKFLINVLPNRLKIKSVLKYSILILLIFSNLLILNWQQSNLNIDNVLTIHPQRLYTDVRDKVDMGACDLMDAAYHQHLSILKAQSPSTFIKVDKWFNMRSIEDLSTNRLVSYTSLCILFIIETIITVRNRKMLTGRFTWDIALILMTLANCIFLPISYGMLGRSYQMPYVSIELKETADSVPDRIRNRVFILKEETDQYIVYDRLNFFQTKYIPKGNVKQVNQLFTITPFQSPIKDQPAICDSLSTIPIQIDY